MPPGDATPPLELYTAAAAAYLPTVLDARASLLIVPLQFRCAGSHGGRKVTFQKVWCHFWSLQRRHASSSIPFLPPQPEAMRVCVVQYGAWSLISPKGPGLRRFGPVEPPRAVILTPQSFTLSRRAVRYPHPALPAYDPFH